MTRGRPPDQALKEAKAIARRQGKLCENTRGRGLLYDFAIHLAFLTIYIQVRRMKTAAETADDILSVCARDIARIRRVPATAVLIRELSARSPAGAWRYFLGTRRPSRGDPGRGYAGEHGRHPAAAGRCTRAGPVVRARRSSGGKGRLLLPVHGTVEVSPPTSFFQGFWEIQSSSKITPQFSPRLPK